jgi:hypothetical protein
MLIDFEIKQDFLVSNAFKTRGCKRFLDACAYVANLPYARNAHPTNQLIPLLENRGTCTTKHQLLATLAYEQGVDDLEVMIGFFKMNKQNMPAIGPVLAKYKLDYIVEAHTYLRFREVYLDFTNATSNENQDYRKTLIQELSVDTFQLFDYKVMVHQLFLENQIEIDPAAAKYTIEQLWGIREECILALS